MALQLADRVQVVASPNTSVSFSLGSTVTGYQNFSVITVGNTVYYGASDGVNWEVGIGTYTSSTLLTRTTVLSSSNSNAAVTSFGASINLWIDYPSSRSVTQDTNGNVSANSFLSSFTTIVSAATTTTLTVASAPFYLITGSSSHTFQLPNATTLVNGTTYAFNNNSSAGSVSVNNGAVSPTLIATINSGGYTVITLLDNSTQAGSWDKHTQAPSNVSWSTNTLSYPGSITSATWNASVIGVTYGGTGLTSTPTNGQIDIGNGTNFTRTTLTQGTGVTITNGAGSISVALTAPVTVQNGGTGVVTVPSNGQIPVGNGTNYVAATITQGTGITITNGAGSITAALTAPVTVANGGLGITTTPANGQLPIGNGTNYVAATITQGTGIAITNGAGSITAALVAPVTIANGGTGLTSTPTNGQLDIGNGTGFTRAAITQGTGITITNGAGSITAALTAPVTVANGGLGVTTTPTNGQIPIGNGTNYVAATLTAGAGIGITNASGSITVAATGSTINSQVAVYTLVAGDAGKIISTTTGGVTIPASVLAAGNIVTIYNNSGSSQTLTQGAGLTLQWAGQTASTTGNRTLGLYGVATVAFITTTNAMITGSGLT